MRSTTMVAGRMILGFDRDEYVRLLESLPPVKIRTSEQAEATERQIEALLARRRAPAALRAASPRGRVMQIEAGERKVPRRASVEMEVSRWSTIWTPSWWQSTARWTRCTWSASGPAR